MATGALIQYAIVTDEKTLVICNRLLCLFRQTKYGFFDRCIYYAIVLGPMQNVWDAKTRGPSGCGVQLVFC